MFGFIEKKHILTKFYNNKNFAVHQVIDSRLDAAHVIIKQLFQNFLF